MVDFTGIGVACFGQTDKHYGRGLQTENDSNELQKENNSCGIQTLNSGGH